MISNLVGPHTRKAPQRREHNTHPGEHEHRLGSDVPSLLDPVGSHDADKLCTVDDEEEARELGRVKVNRVILEDVDDCARGIVDVCEEEVGKEVQEGLLELRQGSSGRPYLSGVSACLGSEADEQSGRSACATHFGPAAHHRVLSGNF